MATFVNHTANKKATEYKVKSFMVSEVDYKHLENQASEVQFELWNVPDDVYITRSYIHIVSAFSAGVSMNLGFKSDEDDETNELGTSAGAKASDKNNIVIKDISLTADSTDDDSSGADVSSNNLPLYTSTGKIVAARFTLSGGFKTLTSGRARFMIEFIDPKTGMGHYFNKSKSFERRFDTAAGNPTA